MDKPTILKHGTPQLTDAYVKALRARPKRYDEFYGDGFGVRVTPNRTKTFVYAYRVGGKKRWMTLGTYPDITLAAARDAHKAAQHLVDDDKDPVQRAEKAKAEAKAEATEKLATPGNRTLRRVFDDFQQVRLKFKYAGRNGGRKDNGAAMRAEFAKHVFPTLGDVLLRDVRRPMVQRILNGVSDSTAFHLYRDLTQFFDWAVREEEIDKSPYAGYSTVEVVGVAKKGERALIDWEITRFYRQLPLVGLQEVTKLALRFMLATGQRSENVCALPKDEINVDGTLWSIPKERFKGGRVGHLVPLSAHARRILQEAARYNTGSAFVFPSPLNKPATALTPAIDEPIRERSVSQAVRKKQGKAKLMEDKPDDRTFGLEKFIPHDLKRTCRTGLARIGYDDGLAKKVIGHVLTGMDAVYNRHDYMQERRAALEAWGEHLDSLA